jgi:hypothetical protein
MHRRLSLLGLAGTILASAFCYAGPGEESNAGGGGGSGAAGSGTASQTQAFDFNGFTPTHQGSGDTDLYSQDLAAMLAAGDDSNNSNQIDEDLSTALQMFGSDEDDDGDDTTVQPLDGFKDVSAEEVTALQTQIQNQIRGMQVPIDMIPEDFNMNDRTQVQAVLSNVLRAAVAQSMSVSFRPMQLAMQSLTNQVDNRIQTSLSNAQKGMSARQTIESIIPEIKNPQHRGMIEMMDKDLKSKGKKPLERANAIRKILNQMGFTPPNSRQGNGRVATNPPNGNPAPTNGNGTPSVRTGKAALDAMFSGMFTPQA